MTLIWSHLAQQQQDEAADYIFQEFGTASTERFYRNISRIEDDLIAFPELGKEEPLLRGKKYTYRSIMVTKYNKMVYYLNDDTIHIAAFWDTRREPLI